CSGTKSDKQDTSSRSGNDTYVLDADIRLKSNKEPRAEVQLTVEHNILANEQQHTVQSEPIYDTYLLEKVDSNITPDSTNMSHRGGEIDQNAENVKMEAHCVNMELKYQNQALKDGQHGQILNETSNKAKIKKEIEVLEIINIELEHSVAKLLAENEKLHKENKHLKQTYKDLYDSIKKIRVQTKDHNDSLIAQINSKTIKNADLKTQIQEKVIANVALKNELRNLKGNGVDTKFAKPSILGKPVLQPPRNQSIVRQPNAFKSERPNFSKPRWVPAVKTFTSSTTKVDYEPLNGSNEDITNPYECDQTLYISAGTLNLSAGTSFNPKKKRLRVWLLKKLMSKNQVPWRIHKQKQSPNSSQGVKEQQRRAHFDDPCHELLHRVYISQGSSSNLGPGLQWMTPATSRSGLVPNLVSQQPCIPPTRDDWDHLFQPMFDEYFNSPSIAITLVQDVAAPRVVVLADSSMSTFID
ncbi:hypothetical protein Tco_1268580, partial [Tanacetum coccineum]